MPAGRIAPNVWENMTRQQRKAWMQLGREMREKLLPEGATILPSPPRNGENVVLPGNGVAGTRGRATNMAATVPDTEDATLYDSSATRTAFTADVSDMTLINAMKANVHSGSAPSGGLHSSRRQMNVKDPLDPKCLLSNKNVSQQQLIPLPKDTAANLALNGNDQQVRMAVDLPHDTVGYRVASTAIQAAPVVITNRTVSKVLRSSEFPDIPMSTDNSTIQWSVSMAVARPHHGAWTLTDDDLLFILGLIDGGANDELANPRHLRLLQYAFPSRKINVNGIGNSRLSGLKIGSFAGTTTTTSNGLPHIKTTYATDEEMSALPKIVMDPQRYDEPTTGRVSMFDE